MKKMKKKKADRRRRPYKAPQVVSEPIFERYALACDSKNAIDRGFMS